MSSIIDMCDKCNNDKQRWMEVSVNTGEPTGKPNGYYYCKNPKQHIVEEDSNEKLATFGIRNKLSCGGVWILGESFGFLHLF